MMKTSTKRITALALTMLMILTSFMACFMSVNAATVPQYEIDMAKRASLTLYKYEMPDVSAATTGGTGEKTDQTAIPKTATPLQGVEFTVYKLDGINGYFDGSGSKKVPTAEEAENMIKSGTYNPMAKVTDSKGMVSWNNLPLGIYYIKETDGPAQVTKPIAPFVVTLPTTDVNGTKWIYDVYAFPKNETAYSDVNLKKVDNKTGEALPNAEFTLYDSDNGTTYAVKQEGLKTGTNGILTIKSLPTQKYYKFVETKTSDESYILDSTVGYEFYVDATGDMLKVVNGETQSESYENNMIVVGNDSPAIHKYILDGEKGAEGIDNTANIGDTVYWKIKTDVPANPEKLKTYNVVDIMDEGKEGISYKDAEIYLVDNKDNNAQLEEGKDYTVAADKTQVTFTFKPASLVGGKEVVIYFNTILTSKARLATDIPNTSKLIYTNNIGTDSTYEKNSETPTVHTGGLQFRKTDGSNPLDGVEFKIYASEADAKEGKNEIQSATSDANGLVTFTGLAYGAFSADAEGKAANGVTGGSREYWVVETKGKEGYSMISAPIKMVVDKDSHLAANNDDVVNNPVPEYPKTGGIGTGIVLASAFAFVGVGVLMLIRRKKNEKN